jgi:hypothetical protein
MPVSAASKWHYLLMDSGVVRPRRWWHRGPFARREVRISVGTVLAFLFLFYVALPLVASHRSQIAALAHINVSYLLLGTLLEVGALIAYTQLTHAVLPPGGPRRRRLFRINLSTLALSHVSPGGTAPGAALGYRLLTQSGVTGADAGFALGTQGVGSAVVLNVIFWCSLVGFLVTNGFHSPLGHHTQGSFSGSVLVVVAAGLGIVLLAAFGGIFLLLGRGQEWASRVVWKVSERVRFLDPVRTTSLVERLARRFAVLLADRPVLVRAIGWATANWVLDAASLWVFVAAFSHFISPIDLLTAYGLANILAAIPVTPGGLGIVEFVLVSMIASFGPDTAAALSGVLAYRAINFWLPIPFGGLAYASLEVQHQRLWPRTKAFLRFHSRNLKVADRRELEEESTPESSRSAIATWVTTSSIDETGATSGATASTSASTKDQATTWNEPTLEPPRPRLLARGRTAVTTKTRKKDRKAERQSPERSARPSEPTRRGRPGPRPSETVVPAAVQLQFDVPPAGPTPGNDPAR